MKKILLDSDELGMAIVTHDNGLFYTVAFDNGGGHSIDITRAQAYILAKTLVDDIIKGVQFFPPPLAPAGPRIPVVGKVEEFTSTFERTFTPPESEDLPHNV